MNYYIIITLFLLLIVNISIAKNDPKTEIDSLIAIPYSIIFDKPTDLIPILKAKIKLAKEIDYKFGTAKLYSQLGTAYVALSEYDKFREAEINSIKLFEEMNNEKELVIEYGLFGYHLRRTNLERSKHYMRLAIKLGEKHSSNKLKDIYDNYGVVLEYANEIDSSRFFYKKALKLKYEMSDSIGIPYGLNHLAQSYSLTGDMDKAFEYMAESDKYRPKGKSNYGRAENDALYGELYKMIEKYDIAIAKFNESLKLAKLIGNKHMAQYNYKMLSEIYQKIGDYEAAYRNLRSHKVYQDSILNTETNQTIAELEIKFETEKKDKEITTSKFKLKEQRGQIIFAASISIILLIFLIGIYRFQKNKQKQVRKELELKNKLAKVESENKISDEKLRISRELHDNIGSNLTFIVSSIDNISHINTNKEDTAKLDVLSNFGRTTLSELRQTIWAMKHDDSSLSELVLRLNDLKINNFTNVEIKLVNEVSKKIHLSSIQNLNLYRVVQEAIQNTIKYANATKIKILFTNYENGIKLSIKDNGAGFELSKVKYGNGISNMEFRCKEAGGIFSITSNKNGTEIICSL